MAEHVLISGLTTLTAVLLALPLGVLFGHTGRGGFVAINLANLGRAIPSLALLVLMLPVALSAKLGLGFWPTFFALVPLGIPPVLTNSYVGVREVDRDIVEAARGMGMRETQVLSQVELPIAAPLIIAGIRNSAVAIVATATLGALVAGGGLGRYIVDGLALQEYPRLFVGAVLVALLSIAVEIAFGAVERVVVSSGLRQETDALGVQVHIQERPR
jgi:osmoprotectant transport system permease protein